MSENIEKIKDLDDEILMSEGCCECEGDCECGCGSEMDYGCSCETEMPSPEEMKIQKDQEELDVLNPLLDKAMELAIESHFGQFDKAGFDYVDHPIRVSTMVSRTPLQQFMSKPNHLKVIIVALLHDILEDTEITEDYLEAIYGKEILDAVISVTRKDGEDYMEFISRAEKHPIGRWVKYFDIQDNLNIMRFARNTEYQLNEKDLKRLNKYMKAFRYLAEKIEPNVLLNPNAPIADLDGINAR